MIKVMIVDDQELIRESLGIILSSKDDIRVVAKAGNGQEVLSEIERQEVDVILMDIRMPVIDGVTCTRIIKERHPEIRIIVLTTFDDDEYIYDAIKYGADGYLLKGVLMNYIQLLLMSIAVQAQFIQISPRKRCACFQIWLKVRLKTIFQQMKLPISVIMNGRLLNRLARVYPIRK